MKAINARYSELYCNTHTRTRDVKDVFVRSITTLMSHPLRKNFIYRGSSIRLMKSHYYYYVLRPAIKLLRVSNVKVSMNLQRDGNLLSIFYRCIFFIDSLTIFIIKYRKFGEKRWIVVASNKYLFRSNVIYLCVCCRKTLNKNICDSLDVSFFPSNEYTHTGAATFYSVYTQSGAV